MVSLARRFYVIREKKHITFEQASKALRIRPEFLQAIETGNYEKLPTAYAYGFVGNYAQYLGMPKQETLAMFRREFDEKKSYSVLPTGMTQTKEFKVKRIQLQQTLLLILGIFFFIAVYILYQYRFVFLSPPLFLDAPAENEVITTNEIQVQGKSDPNATVMVNNSVVSLDPEGNFSKNIDLFSGKTIIRVTAENRFGKKAVIDRVIEVKPR